MADNPTTQPSTPEQLIQRLAGQNDVIIFADSNHGNTDIRDLFARLVPTLSKSGVKNIAIEAPRNYQTEIDSYLSDSDKNAVPPGNEELAGIFKNSKAYGENVIYANIPETENKERIDLLTKADQGDDAAWDKFLHERNTDNQAMASYLLEQTKHGDQKTAFLVGAGDALTTLDEKKLGLTKNVGDYFGDKKVVNVLLLPDNLQNYDYSYANSPDYTIRVPSGAIVNGLPEELQRKNLQPEKSNIVPATQSSAPTTQPSSDASGSMPPQVKDQIASLLQNDPVLASLQQSPIDVGAPPQNSQAALPNNGQYMNTEINLV